MLECGTNYKGTMSSKCTECNALDNEDHRLNHCIRYRSINRYDNIDKFDFNSVYSCNIDNLTTVIREISKVWNVKNSNGTMNNALL